MQIFFKKITQQKSNFNLDINDVKIEGIFYRDKRLVCIDARLDGKISNQCFRCGNDFIQEINSNLELKISQNEYKDQQDETLLDIIEVFNDKICFNEIFISEIDSIKSDYHACKNC